MVLILNSYTRWGHCELMDMDVEELVRWTQDAVDIYRRKK